MFFVQTVLHLLRWSTLFWSQMFGTRFNQPFNYVSTGEPVVLGGCNIEQSSSVWLPYALLGYIYIPEIASKSARAFASKP